MTKELVDQLLRAFVTKRFDRWAIDEGLTDTVLSVAVEEISQGLIGDSLGGNVYKKRIRLPGRGKRGGARTLIAYKAAEKVFFTFGFAKNERENIDREDLKAIKELAAELLGYADDQLKKAIRSGALREIERRVEK